MKYLLAMAATGLGGVWGYAQSESGHTVPSHNGVEYRISAGFNIGAASPLGLPAEIRKITEYNPTFNLSLGAEATKMLNDKDKWGVLAGVTVENKGAETGIDAKNYHLTMNILSGDNIGSSTGYFTGHIKNTTKITYITVPVCAVYRLSDGWRFQGGAYLSYAANRSFEGRVSDGHLREDPLHPIVAVGRAEYDYSSDIRRIDTGLILGARRRIYGSLDIRANLQWGLLSTLSPSTRKIDMNTYNIYLNLALTYAI